MERANRKRVRFAKSTAIEVKSKNEWLLAFAF